jgi:hypothetical protein
MKAPKHGTRFGKWIFNAEQPASLDFDAGWCYQILMKDLATAAVFAHWLTHLSEKGWFTPEIAGQFVQAVMELTDYAHFKGGNWCHGKDFVQPWKQAEIEA